MERIFDLLPYTLKKYDRDVAIAGEKKGKWIKYSTRQYIEISNYISFGLLKLGINKGDKIATFSNNRPEWNFTDMGMLQIGAVHVPVYATIDEKELTYILNETETKIIFVSSRFYYKKVKKILSHVPGLERIYTFDNIDDATPSLWPPVKVANHFDELIESGKKNIDHARLEQIKKEIKPDDLASIIYTTGNLSTSNGVMLTHKNHVTNFLAVAYSSKLDSSYKTVMSYLPLCHAYERTCNYTSQYLGLSIYYAGTSRSLIDNFKNIKPDIFTAVPFLLEKVYAGIIKNGSTLKGLNKKIFYWALNLGARYNFKKKTWWYNFQLRIADELVFYRWRNVWGGNLKRIFCGGAALNPHLLKIFRAAKIPVYEGYGTTETSPLIAINHYGSVKHETAGQIILGAEVKIAGDGEILCRGSNVMKGYYKNPRLTASVIDEQGWFHTGDIGTIDNDGYLKITGNKKDIFKISSGIYVSPEIIENKLQLSPFIDHAFVYGANKNFLSAIIAPDFDFLQNWCLSNNISYTNSENIIKNKLLINEIQEVINKHNRDCKNTEIVKKFDVINDEWNITSGEVTTGMRLSRNFIKEKYQSIIEK